MFHITNQSYDFTESLAEQAEPSDETTISSSKYVENTSPHDQSDTSHLSLLRLFFTLPQRTHHGGQWI